jgi:hypothetical protein
MQTTETMTTNPIRYATANDVFATLNNGGSISVEEYPSGDIAQAALSADRITSRGDHGATMVLALDRDSVDGTPIDRVYFHSDRSDRLAVIDRARAALDAAEAALRAVGYVDNAFMLEDDDDRAVSERESDRAKSASEAVSAALLEVLGRHLERPVKMNDLEALCNVVGVCPSEITRRSEEIQRSA